MLLDAFLVAFRIPNLFREMLAEGALASSFTKVFSQRSEKSRLEALQLFQDCLALFLLASAIFCSLGVIFAPELVGLMTLGVATGEAATFTDNAILLTRILFPYLALTTLGALVMGALHEKGSFFLSAVSPALFNFGFILGAILFSSWAQDLWGPRLQDSPVDPRGIGLAVGVLLGGVGQFAIQLQAMRGDLRGQLAKLRWRFPWPLRKYPEVKSVLILMGPATIAASAGPINVFVNTNFATSLGEGAVSWLNFAFRLLQLPIGLFGVAIGVAILPSLSKLLQPGSSVISEKASSLMQQGLGMVGWIMGFCFVLLVTASEDMIVILFEHGKFTQKDTLATADALQAYSWGVLAYGLIKVLTAFYYAIDKTSFAMKVALGSIGINLLGNYLLVQRFGHVGLAYTSSITLSCNALFLFLGSLKFGLQLQWKTAGRSLLFLGAAVLVARLLSQELASSLQDLLQGALDERKLIALAQLIVKSLASLAVFLLCLGVSQPQLLSQLRQRLAGRRD